MKNIVTDFRVLIKGFSDFPSQADLNTNIHDEAGAFYGVSST